jgi:DNA modification methylase
MPRGFHSRTMGARVARLKLRSRHRLICGDSTAADDVAKVMDGQEADMCFTSPPYAQQRDYGAAKEKVANWDALMHGVFSLLPTKAGAQVLVNLGLVHRDGEWVPYWSDWIEWMRQAGFKRFGWYVWDQGPGLPGDWSGRLAPSHEFIFHFNRASRKPHKTVPSKHAGKTIGGGGVRGKDGVVKAKTQTGMKSGTHRIPDSVFRVMRHKGKVDGGAHPAVFPVALVEAALEAYAKAGDVLYEPFCGSGTQIIAAEKFGARCMAVDIDPSYCDVAIRRFQNFSGKHAILASCGQSFSEVSEARAK